MENSEHDTRNLLDQFKGMANEAVFDVLAQKRSCLEIAIENVSHDFNMGTIVRNANNFNVARVHIIGRKKYNRRGAMCTDKYLEVIHWAKMEEFIDDQRKRERELVAIENNIPEGSGFPKLAKLANKKFIQNTTLIFGSESDGISNDLLKLVDDVREIESFGSTRSVNVGVASGIAMYEWAKQCLMLPLTHGD